MSGKRKDKKGRALKTGESQRKDSRYQYRFTDDMGKRHTIYATSLQELREKEEEIQKQGSLPQSYDINNITVAELVERHVELKQGVRRSRKNYYKYTLKMLKRDFIGQQKAKNIKISDMKLWILNQYKAGRAYGTIANYLSVMRPAFQLFCDDDIIAKNPCCFKLSDVIPNNAAKRVALTPDQQKDLMEFIRNDNIYCKYYDMFVALLNTGLRVSELCGLTVNDLDFDNHRIKIDHQLLCDNHGKYYIEKTKSKSGIRIIPMSEEVYISLKNALERHRIVTKIMIDGYAGFVFLTAQSAKPMRGMYIERIIRRLEQSYKRKNPHSSLPHITPHVFRHTFCTNMANAGMDIKALQYIMGHSNASITLDLYSHVSYEHAEDQFAKILNISEWLDGSEDVQQDMI